MTCQEFRHNLIRAGMCIALFMQLVTHTVELANGAGDATQMHHDSDWSPCFLQRCAPAVQASQTVGALGSSARQTALQRRRVPGPQVPQHSRGWAAAGAAALTRSAPQAADVCRPRGYPPSHPGASAAYLSRRPSSAPAAVRCEPRAECGSSCIWERCSSLAECLHAASTRLHRTLGPSAEHDAQVMAAWRAVWTKQGDQSTCGCCQRRTAHESHSIVGRNGAAARQPRPASHAHTSSSTP